MAIGAIVRRVPAVGGGQIADANINKVIMIGQGERGIAASFGNIFNFGDFEEVAGGFNVSKRMAYIARSFYDALKINTNVEMIRLARHRAHPDTPHQTVSGRKGASGADPGRSVRFHVFWLKTSLQVRARGRKRGAHCLDGTGTR